MKLFTMISLSLLCAGTLSAETRPNIIWIEADDLMPRFMNKLGDGFGLTPNLDRLATVGTYFPNAMCQGPMCGPSRNGLLANLYSHNLGFYRNGHLRNMPKGTWTFPPVLQKAGYQTAYIGKSHVKASADNPKASKDDALHGYGFDYVQCTGERYAMWKALSQDKPISGPFVEHLKRRGKYEQFLQDADGYGKKSTMEEDIDYLDGFTAQVAIHWLTKERDSKKPFFMWFNFCLPHGPYDVPQRWYDKVADLKIPPPKTDRFGHDIPEPLLVDNRPIKNAEGVAKDRLGEAASVAFMDARIGELLDALETAGQLENTVVVFFSDHSIFLGNHGRLHKGTLFEESLSTSMIVCFPKRFAGDKINVHPMELMDLVPTTFELAGIKSPNEIAKNGLSIVPLLEGKKTNGRTYAFSEILGAQSACDGRYRYIISEGVEILYDHETDPWEMENVASKYPEITAKMGKAVADWMENTGPVYPPKTF
ncbi:sulfatase family protein [Pontiella sulfatireligans]|uniref:Arylsulfatase n=1 Tax=Pontiella sulfatireligans TaxID=2750658 RepID=A0A6C2UGW3_9BACT|nr:sulfatase-like hydrolase/transferase [Pontiella sulfatireligans]SPS74203.1 sulfatase S1_N.C [Kiritimatiellales bacterium]VGO18604.1 Arylsulfatase [Pontiella sulfatireligans]